MINTETSRDATTLNELDRQIIITSLNNMVERDTFYLFKLEECMELACVSAPPEAMRRLRPLDCVRFSGMPDDVRSAVIEIITAIFRDGAGMPFDRLFDANSPEVPAGTPRRGLLQRMLGGSHR